MCFVSFSSFLFSHMKNIGFRPVNPCIYFIASMFTFNKKIEGKTRKKRELLLHLRGVPKQMEKEQSAILVHAKRRAIASAAYP